LIAPLSGRTPDAKTSAAAISSMLHTSSLGSAVASSFFSVAIVFPAGEQFLTVSNHKEKFASCKQRNELDASGFEAGNPNAKIGVCNEHLNELCGFLTGIYISRNLT
jgi:hypothetical protein